jgi:hypothetical protein
MLSQLCWQIWEYDVTPVSGSASDWFGKVSPVNKNIVRLNLDIREIKVTGLEIKNGLKNSGNIYNLQ